MGLYLGKARIENLGETFTPREIRSVNGKTPVDGEITIFGSDTRVSESDFRKIDAALSDAVNRIPANVSQLSNDAGYLTSVPAASSSRIGGVKINGNNLAVLADGTLSAGGGSGAYSKSYITDTALGIDDRMSDLRILKVTQNEYAEYLLNHTRAELSNCVFILSSDVEDVFGKRIINAGEPTLSSDVATKNYVDQHVPEIDVKALTNLQVIRPDSTDNLYLSVQVFSDQAMANRLTSIDSYQAANRAYFCGFSTNGSSYAWTNQPAEGFNEFYSNMPVLIRLKNMNLPDIQEYFVLYAWYSLSGSSYSYSDYYSAVIPATTEAGANSGAVGYLLQAVQSLQAQIDELKS